MQAKRTHAKFSVSISTMCKGKPRSKPVWVMRYRLPSGKDSSKVLGAAWTKRGRRPSGYLTKGEALLKAEAFAAEYSTDTLSTRRTVPCRGGRIHALLRGGEGASRLDAERVSKHRRALGRSGMAGRAGLGRSRADEHLHCGRSSGPIRCGATVDHGGEGCSGAAGSVRSAVECCWRS